MATKPTTNNTEKTARIVVIGAGAAGIAAATRLVQAGFNNVLVLEAEQRVGGRVHTIPFADNVVDLGAQWCHGAKNNAVFELVKDRNMLEDTGTIYDDYICVRSNREVVPEQTGDLLKTIAFNSIPERQTELIGYEGSLGAYLTEKFWNEFTKLPQPVDRTIAREFFENFKKFECSVEASDTVFEVSGTGHLEYWLCEGDLLLNWRDKGYHSLLRVLMQSKTEAKNDVGILEKRILYGRRVENIEWSGPYNKNIVRTWNGDIIEADHVICTVSLGVLKENVSRMFTPPLPLAKNRAIEGLKLGTVDKFFMEFDENFVPPDWSGFSFLWLEEDLAQLRNTDNFWLESVIGFYRVSYQPRVWQGWIIGPHARHMETLPEETVLKALLWLFRKFFPFRIPQPKHFIRTQWHANPNFRGSYTFRSMYTDELRTGAWDLAEPLLNDSGKPILQFAGESTHRHYYSTVHGAVESGWREAQRLIDYYQGKPAAHL